MTGRVPGWGHPTGRIPLRRTLFALGASVLASLALTVAPAVAGNGNGHDQGSDGKSVARGAIANSSGQGATHNKIPGGAPTGGTLQLTFSACHLSLTGGGLVAGSALWLYSSGTGYSSIGAVASDGSLPTAAADLGVGSSGVTDTWTAYDLPTGVNPTNDGTGSAYYTSSPLLFTACTPGLVFSHGVNCSVRLTGTLLVPGSQIWVYSSIFYVGWYGDLTVDPDGSFSSAITNGDTLTDTLYAYNVAAGVTPHTVDPDNGTVLALSGAFQTGGCTL